MGIGFMTGHEGLAVPSKELVVPEYGLSLDQMRILGLTNDTSFMKLPEVKAETITAKYYYGGDPVPITNEATRMPTTMMAADTKAPGQVPPDLPSLLLDARICFIGMPLVAAVTELVISELLWLNYAQPDKPVYMYINSMGSQNEMGEAVAFEQEAYSILDTMNYIKCDVFTLVIGQAMGNAAMLLAAGKKGNRFSLPNARIMTAPPRINRSFGNVSNMMIRANELERNTQEYVEMISRFTGRPQDEVRKDVGRNRYFTPESAIEYGLIDRVVSRKDMAIDKKNYEAMLKASQSQQRGQQRMAGAGAGGPSTDV